MCKTFKIGLGSLGGTWDLVALNAPILSKGHEYCRWSMFLVKPQVNENSEAMGFLETFQNVGKTFNKKL